MNFSIGKKGKRNKKDADVRVFKLECKAKIDDIIASCYF